MHVFVYRGDGVCMYRTDIYMCICSEKTCKWDQFVLKNWFIYIVNDEFITENILKHKTFSWCLCLYGATTHANETDLYCKVISKYYIWGTHHREHSQTQDVLLMSVSIWSNSTCKCHQFMLQNWFVYIINDEPTTENILKNKTWSWCICQYEATTHANATD